MIEPISDEIVRSQQQLTDRFQALGIIPTAIQVADERTTAQNANDSMPSTVACAAAPPAALSDSRNALDRVCTDIAKHHAEGADEKGRPRPVFSGGRR